MEREKNNMTIVSFFFFVCLFSVMYQGLGPTVVKNKEMESKGKEFGYCSTLSLRVLSSNL